MTTGALVVALTASLTSTGVLLTERTALRTDLAASTASTDGHASELEELRDALAASEEGHEELEQRVEDLEAELAETEDELTVAQDALAAAEEAGRQAAAPAPPPQPEPEPEPTASDSASACDYLGGWHEQGDDYCAELIQEMEDCRRGVESDPLWEPIGSGLWENLETGSITNCDI